MLMIERLRLAAAQVAALIAQVPDERLREALPDELRLADRTARLFGLDLIARARATAIDSLRRLPDLAEQSPAAADGWLQHAIALIAWLDGQTDQVPPVLAFGSGPAIASPSSDDPEPGRQPSYVSD